MTHGSRFLLAFFLLASAVSSATEFHVLADPGADFSGIRRFRIDKVVVTQDGGAAVPPATVEGLKGVVRSALIREGMKEDKDHPDIVVELSAGIEVPLEVRDTQDLPYFDGTKWQILPREEADTAPVPPPQPARFGDGTLRIDLRRVRDGHIIWRGTVDDAVQIPLSVQQAARAVDLLITYYPHH
ncbi:MAG TPA: DUF4136 domain-containing protein [Moraxellaceae bacterium]|nr:DUF4136 domain-containing protein [Moraxellaceae bacterium]